MVTGLIAARVGGDGRHEARGCVLPGLDGDLEVQVAQRLAGDRADGAQAGAGEPLRERPAGAPPPAVSSAARRLAVLADVKVT